MKEFYQHMVIMRTSNEDQFRDTKLSKLRNVKMENC